MGALKAFVIAGEPSGDALGAALMDSLRRLEPGVQFDGVGGAQMRAEGLTSLFDMSELSVMGIAEVLPKFVHLKRRIAQTAQAVIAARPDVLITIDSPDFCFRVAQTVRDTIALRTVHYVAPTVWAWRPKRAVKMARFIDHVLALFPFEPPYMTAAGMSCDFVGHPVATQAQATVQEVTDFRARHGLTQATPLMLVLPGSRRSEISRMAPVFGRTIARLAQTHPGIAFVLPTAPAVAKEVRAEIASWPVKPLLLDPHARLNGQAQSEKRAAFRAADIALATSGSVALELAAADTPMVSAYDMHWLSRAITQRLVTTDTGNLINLVSETRTVPEVIGKSLTETNLLNALENVHGDARAQRVAMAKTMDLLGRGGEDPGLRAARSVLRKV